MFNSLKKSTGMALLASGLGLTFIGGLTADDSHLYRADRKIRGADQQHRGAIHYYAAPVAIQPARQAYQSFSQDTGPAPAAPAPVQPYYVGQAPCYCAPAPAYAAPQPPMAYAPAPAPLASNRQAYQSFSANPSAAAPAVQYYQQPYVPYNSARRSGLPNAGHKIRGLGQ